MGWLLEMRLTSEGPQSLRDARHKPIQCFALGGSREHRGPVAAPRGLPSERDLSAFVSCESVPLVGQDRQAESPFHRDRFAVSDAKPELHVTGSVEKRDWEFSCWVDGPSREPRQRL